jgi:hypothetical protein
MRAVAIDEFGGIEKMKPRELAVPEVATDEILIRVDTAGVGVWDPFEREGGSLKSSACNPTFLMCGVGMALELWKRWAMMFIILNAATGFTVLTS